MKSTSSGSGLRSVRAIASTPRSATSRRRISASTSSRSSRRRVSNSSCCSRVGELAVGGLALLAGAAHHAGAEVVEVELAQRPVEVVRAADRPARLHARELGDGHRGEPAQLVAVHAHQRVEEHLGELLARELPAAATRRPRPTSPRGRARRGRPSPSSVDTRGVQREVHVEDGLERLPVVVVLHERRAERGLGTRRARRCRRARPRASRRGSRSSTRAGRPPGARGRSPGGRRAPGSSPPTSASCRCRRAPCAPSRCRTGTSAARGASRR